ncbi:two-component sensor [Pseudomonas aeruginosa]|nr:two-component sensor [Pseudomonas aeruginosa]
MTDTARADALLADLPADGRGRLKVFLGAAPGGGQDLRHAAGRPGPVAPGRETARRGGRDPLAGGNRVPPRRRAAAAAAQPRVSRDETAGNGPRRSPRRPAGAGPGRRTGPQQRSRQPPRQALAGHPGVAGGGDRRLHNGQRPAPGKPQRPGPRHHRRAGPRDGAGLGVAGGLRDRPHRPAAARAAGAPARGQGLRAGTGAGGDRRVLLADQPHRAA